MQASKHCTWDETSESFHWFPNLLDTSLTPPVLLSNKKRNHTLNDKNRMFFSCKTKHTLLKSRKERSEDWCIVRYLRNTILSNSDRWINWSFKLEWKSSLYTFFSSSKAFEDLNLCFCWIKTLLAFLVYFTDTLMPFNIIVKWIWPFFPHINVRLNWNKTWTFLSLRSFLPKLLFLKPPSARFAAPQRMVSCVKSNLVRQLKDQKIKHRPNFV